MPPRASARGAYKTPPLSGLFIEEIYIYLYGFIYIIDVGARAFDPYISFADMSGNYIIYINRVPGAQGYA